MVWVMAPADEVDDAEGVAEVRLEPFSEHIQVPEYQRDCRCAEWSAHLEARRRTHEENADLVREIKETRERFAAERAAHASGSPAREPSVSLSESHQEYWATHIVPVMSRIKAMEQALFQSMKDSQLPDAACPDCRGTGSYASTYNPDAKWDWWEIGGRWHGDFDPTGADRDVLTVEEVASVIGDARVLPVAILDPAGEWHEEGSVGWFGTVSDQKAAQEWERDVDRLITGYPGHAIIVCDCHI